MTIDSTFFEAYYYLGLAQWWDKTDGNSNNPSGDATLKLILDKKLYHNELEKWHIPVLFDSGALS